MHPQHQCRLLQLPAELQLIIFEYAVIEENPLLVNCGCDSSYFRDIEKWHQDQNLWSQGEIRSPSQPALTRTCSMIRNISLPMFYQQNSFRAHYCYETNFDMAVHWLRMIGQENRRLLKDFCFWDWNPTYDRQMPRDMWKVKRSEIFRGMGGSMETLGSQQCCCHRVTFGEEDEDYYELVPSLFEK